MLIKSDRDGFHHPTPSEITPHGVYRQRRDLIRWMAGGAAGGLTVWQAGNPASTTAAPVPRLGLRSNTPVRLGKSVWPKPSRPWCSTACVAASVCRPTVR